jgi:serine/threonine-protein kinase
VAETSLVGRKLGAYKVEALLGEGAMGEVYRGVHEALGRIVAIKTLKPAVAADTGMIDRFFAEARAVNIIRHENIVECTDLVHEPGGTSYVVMEFLEGRTLAAAIKEAGRLPPRRAARIAAQIADAIAAAHEKGIIHRDLKPDNVFLIRRAGTSDYVKVLDFGIARLRPEYGVTATATGALIGTPAYMSPEQAKGERVVPASDIYALGVILFHMLTGRLPFRGASLPMMLMAHVAEIPKRVDELVPDVPRALADAVARALEKDPAARPPDMSAFRVMVLEGAGLPSELTASLLASGGGAATPVSGVPVSASSAGVSALGATVGSAARPKRTVDRSAEAMGETLAPDAAAGVAPAPSVAPPPGGAMFNSSVSGAAGEVQQRASVATPPAGKRRGVLIGGVAALIAGGIAVGVLVAGRGKSAGPTTPVASPGPADAGAIAAAPPDAAVRAAVGPADATPIAAGPADAGAKAGTAGKVKTRDHGHQTTTTAPPPDTTTPAAGPPDAGPKKHDLTKELVPDETPGGGH